MTDDNNIVKNKLLVYLASLMEAIRQENIIVVKFHVANKTKDNILQSYEIIRDITLDIRLCQRNEANTAYDPNTH